MVCCWAVLRYTWPLFCLSQAVQNSWLLYCHRLAAKIYLIFQLLMAVTGTNKIIKESLIVHLFFTGSAIQNKLNLPVFILSCLLLPAHRYLSH